MATTKKNNTSKADSLFQRGLDIFEGKGCKKDERKGALLIAEAAELGNKEAQDWIDDYCYDDDALVQGES